jgi:hypothetical protein
MKYVIQRPYTVFLPYTVFVVAHFGGLFKMKGFDLLCLLIFCIDMVVVVYGV